MKREVTQMGREAFTRGAAEQAASFECYADTKPRDRLICMAKHSDFSSLGGLENVSAIRLVKDTETELFELSFTLLNGNPAHLERLKTPEPAPAGPSALDNLRATLLDAILTGSRDDLLFLGACIQAVGRDERFAEEWHRKLGQGLKLKLDIRIEVVPTRAPQKRDPIPPSKQS